MTRQEFVDYLDSLEDPPQVFKELRIFYKERFRL